MITTIRREFLEQYKNMVFGIFIHNLKDTGLEDTYTKIQTPIVEVKAGVSSMELSSARLNVDNILMKLQDKSPFLSIKSEKFSLNFTFNYLIETKPDIIRDKGIGYAFFKQLKMVFALNPFIDNEVLKIEITDF